MSNNDRKSHSFPTLPRSRNASRGQAIPDTVSLDALKRHTHHLALHVFFRRHFGRKGMLRQARANFVGSCAAYSVVCYLLQVGRGFAKEIVPEGETAFSSGDPRLS